MPAEIPMKATMDRTAMRATMPVLSPLGAFDDEDGGPELSEVHPCKNSSPSEAITNAVELSGRNCSWRAPPADEMSACDTIGIRK
jgi:hypothetical protein